MQSKLFEIRDRLTMISVAATLMVPDPKNKQETYLMHKAGFPPKEQRLVKSEGPWVYLLNIDTATASPYPHSWGGMTMPKAHDFIAKNFHKLEHGDVIDIEWLRGEVEFPKRAERFERNGPHDRDLTKRDDLFETKAHGHIQLITRTGETPYIVLGDNEFEHTHPKEDGEAFYTFYLHGTNDWMYIREYKDHISGSWMECVGASSAGSHLVRDLPEFYIAPKDVPKPVMIAYYRKYQQHIDANLLIKSCTTTTT